MVGSLKRWWNFSKRMVRSGGGGWLSGRRVGEEGEDERAEMKEGRDGLGTKHAFKLMG